MFYRVRADLAFTDLDEGNDFYHDCVVALPKSNLINPGQPNQEGGTIVMEECYHDENPQKPCLTMKVSTLSSSTPP